MVSNEILQMLTSKDREMQRLGITLLGYKETKEHLNELNKMLAEYKIQILRSIRGFNLDGVYVRRANHLIEYDNDGSHVIHPVKRKDDNNE